MGPRVALGELQAVVSFVNNKDGARIKDGLLGLEADFGFDDVAALDAAGFGRGGAWSIGALVATESGIEMGAAGYTVLHGLVIGYRVKGIGRAWGSLAWGLVGSGLASMVLMALLLRSNWRARSLRV